MVANAAAFSGVTASVPHRWGGDYRAISATPDGFLAVWVDHSENGVPQLWSSASPWTRTASS